MRSMIVVLALCLSTAVAAESDPRALKIADAVMERLGGAEAWEATRFVRWDFFGGRSHYWDKQRGDVRMEIPERLDEEGKQLRPELLVLMNVDSREGRVWAGGEPVTDGDKLAEYLETGHQIWINDSYWMFMPYKLQDPGVTLRYGGEKTLEDGRAGDLLEMTFGEGIGYTPQNKYELFVSRDSGLIEAWSFYADAADEAPRFTMPWAGWQQFGDIWLATDHGRQRDWKIEVPDELPRTLFTE
jgi:hypothetical protein